MEAPGPSMKTCVMLDFHSASDRAVRYAVETGHMPNMSLIHARQRGEGYEPCFGRAVERCPRPQCRWFHQCMALLDFDADSRSRPQTTPYLPAPLRHAESVSIATPSVRESATALLR